MGHQVAVSPHTDFPKIDPPHGFQDAQVRRMIPLAAGCRSAYSSMDGFSPCPILWMNSSATWATNSARLHLRGVPPELLFHSNMSPKSKDRNLCLQTHQGSPKSLSAASGEIFNEQAISLKSRSSKFRITRISRSISPSCAMASGNNFRSFFFQGVLARGRVRLPQVDGPTFPMSGWTSGLHASPTDDQPSKCVS